MAIWTAFLSQEDLIGVELGSVFRGKMRGSALLSLVFPGHKCRFWGKLLVLVCLNALFSELQ